MIINIFQSLKDASSNEEALLILKRIGRLELFERLFNEYSDKAFPVFRYVLLAYSIESPHLEVSDNWEEQRRRIASIAGVPKDDSFEEVVKLHTRALWKTVDEYLYYQGSREFRHLNVLKNLYERMLSSTFVMPEAEEGEKEDKINYDQLYKNTEHAKNLWDDINIYEQAVRAKHGEAWTRVNNSTQKELNEKKKSNSLNLESSNYIHS